MHEGFFFFFYFSLHAMLSETASQIASELVRVFGHAWACLTASYEKYRIDVFLFWLSVHMQKMNENLVYCAWSLLNISRNGLFLK